MLTELKQREDHVFLRNADSIALQQSLRDLDTAYRNFFKKTARYPRFKSKHSTFQSYRTINQSNNIRIEGKRIKLPKIGWIKIKQSREIGVIRHVTVERMPSGKYFIVLNVEYDDIQRHNEGEAVGLDVGLKEFYTDSNGNVVNAPKTIL